MLKFHKIFNYFFLFFFRFCFALKTANLRFHVNSPNLNPTIHLLTLRVYHRLPACIITSNDKNVKGITEDRVLILFSDVWWTECECIKYIIRQILGEK